MLAKGGVAVPMTDLFGVRGRLLIETCELGAAYRVRVESLRQLIASFYREIKLVERDVQRRLAEHLGYQAIQRIPGAGPLFAPIFVVEIGDVTRFKSAAHLCSWAGLTPLDRESDKTLHRDPITNKEAASCARSQPRRPSARLQARSSGRTSPGSRRTTPTPQARDKVVRVGFARKIVTLVFYGLRDGQIRSKAIEAA